ncbi:ankyrin repeat and SOCS box protein 2 isoform X2 [Spea bombifrons]|uniref:ankyrin repeat and SOCS box protein 2 isoform X2 n=1 Tax=Spea bombifrons TaxID=233779 RepID=UPI002349DDC3|nr:ankyrin repeat and SOCS box protein 2 isoform X2 [Spea bombifrons]
MATQVSNSGPARSALGSEDYSLYSSLSEEELIQMAIEQSLGETNPGQTTGPRHQKLPANVNEGAAAASWNRPTTKKEPPQPPANNSTAQSPGAGSGKAVRKSEWSPIEETIMKKDEEALNEMMKAGKHLYEPNKDGWLPLHEAAYYGALGCAKLLLQAYPCTIDQRTLLEETATYMATVRGNLDVLRFLLHSGAEPDIANKSRETPLYKACEQRNADAVRLLVEYRADVNHRCNRGWTALHEAVARNDLEIIEILEKNGAKIEAKNCYGITPLFVAAQSGQLEALRYLIKCGAEIDTQANDNATALFEASKNGHEEIVECLLAQGADANKQNKDGLLPIHVAAKKRDNDEIVSMLIPVTSRVRVKRSGISPLHIAAERNNDDVLEELVNAGYDVNFTLSHDRARLYEDKRSTALYFAVMNNNIHATQLLLEAGANPNIDLINPLLISIRHGCCKTMKLLLDHGANINAYIATHPTSFPATIMFSMRFLSILKFIMDLGCDGETCFKCDYGNGPHPPIEMTSREQTGPKQPKIVQFCEMVSTPDLSRWAGPIIDVLLDYVGNVTLCSRLQEHLDSFEDWECIKAKSEPPRPLTHLCRLRVRELVGINRIRLLNTLPLPQRLLRYLTYDNSDGC